MTTVEILAAARFWRVDPDTVRNWTIIDFLDRQEFMYIFNHYNSPRKSDDDVDGEVWQGRE